MGNKINSRTAILAVAAAAGFTALSVSPANAATMAAYPNCDAAAAVGVYNIPAGAPGYGPHLDSDRDGIGCEAAGVAYRPAPTNQQITRVPAGGANTGVAQEPSNLGSLALGGGLVLAAAAGGAFMIRRRAVSKA